MNQQYGGPQAPGGVQPHGMQPQPGQPQAMQPQPGQPQAMQPHPGQPQAMQPHPGQPQAMQPHAGQPHPGQPQAMQPQAMQPHAGQPQAMQQAAAGAAMIPHAAAGMQPMVGAAICGEAMQQGERVVYYRTMDYSTSKTIYLVLGILFMPVFFIGGIFLWMRSKIEKDNPKAIAVTTNRILIENGNGFTTTHWLQTVADVEPIRQQGGGGGGGLLGALVAAGVSAALNSMADKKAKIDRKYWNRAIGVVLIDQQGNKTEVRCQEKPKEMIDLGMFVAQGMYQGGFTGFPDVPVGF
jgi:hypothetical protein